MGFRWLRAVLFGVPFLLAACSSEYEYVYEYVDPPCRHLVEIEDGNLSPDSRTVKLTVPQGIQGGYYSTGGPAVFRLAEVAGNCVPSYSASLAVPPGNYSLGAVLGHRSGKGDKWTIDSVEFLPDTHYALSYVYGRTIDAQTRKFKDSGQTAYPLILRVHKISGERETLEVATFGPWQWAPGLTKSQIDHGLYLLVDGTSAEVFLAQRDKWLAENARLLGKAPN